MSRLYCATIIAPALLLTQHASAAGDAKGVDHTPAQIMRFTSCKKLVLEASYIATACKGFGMENYRDCEDPPSPRTRAIEKRSRQLKCPY